MEKSNVLWWHQYRKMMYKRPIKITKERLIRTSLRKALLEYCRNSSIASFKYLFTTNNARILEKASWVFMFILMGILSSVYLNTLHTNLISKPFIISTESTVHPIQKIDFPAVALCNINRISKRAVTTFALRVLPRLNMFSLEELEAVFSQLGSLINLTPETEEIIKFNTIIPMKAVLNTNVAETILNMTPSCDKMLIRCFWNGLMYPCKDLFTVCRTSHGHCCCFNYIKDNEVGRFDINREIKRQNHPGTNYGLSVLLDSDVEDYCYPIRNAQGFDVLIFDSQHYPDHNAGFLVHQILNTKKAMELQLNSRIQIATEEFKRYSVEERKCLFRDERPKLYGNKYSYSSCIIMCRTKIVLYLCRCIPYYFPIPLNFTRVCTLFDLKCLNKFKDKLYNIFPKNRQSDYGLELELQDSMDCPECLPECEFTKYYTKAISLPLNIQELNQKTYPHLLKKTMNVTNKSVFVLYSHEPYGILNKLDVVNYWFEFASIFGGSVALLLGFTFVSISEVFYFLTLKLITFMREKVNEIRLRNYNY